MKIVRNHSTREVSNRPFCRLPSLGCQLVVAAFVWLACITRTSSWMPVVSQQWVGSYTQRHPKSRLLVSSSSSSSSSCPLTIYGPWNETVFASTNCWGRRPLLMRKAFDTSNLFDWANIVELACSQEEGDESITSRLISHKPGSLNTFRLDFGPFIDSELEVKLENDDNYASTLVVNDVDRWIPSVSDWMDTQFAFLPRWRRDDAQVSLARKGGGIGPHVDNYDVFLIQVCGSREWSVGVDDPISVTDEFASLVDESEVRILDTTTPTTELCLEEGDCLYLPPRILHHGTSTSDECITLSVGCRTPSAADLLAKMAEAIGTSTSPAAVTRYTDVDLLQRRFDTDKSLSSNVKQGMKQLIMNLVEDFLEDDKRWDDLLGRTVTEPNRPDVDYPTPLDAMDPDWKDELGEWADATKALEAVIAGKGILRRAEGVAFAWSKLQDSCRLYAQGRVFQVAACSDSTCSLLCRIANGPPLDSVALEKALGDGRSPALKHFLVDLLDEGMLYGDDEGVFNCSPDN